MFLVSLVPLRASDFVYSLIVVGYDMKFVINNSSMGNGLGCNALISSRPIHTNSFNIRSLLWGKLVKKTFQRLLLLAFGQVEDFTCFSIQDNSKIMMMWSNGLFINKDDSQVIEIRLWKVFGKDLLVPSSGCIR